MEYHNNNYAMRQSLYWKYGQTNQAESGVSQVAFNLKSARILRKYKI